MIRWLEDIALRTWNYWFSLVADIAFGVAVMGYVLAHIADAPEYLLWVPVAMVVGSEVQGLWEYTFHRWVYHGAHATSPRGHQYHHAHPRALLALPWFVGTLVIAAFLGFYHLIIADPVMASAAATGTIFRYVLYGVLHHSFHHASLRWRWWRSLRGFHNVHHALPERNFGVSTRLWDRVFGTHHKPAR